MSNNLTRSEKLKISRLKIAQEHGFVSWSEYLKNKYLQKKQSLTTEEYECRKKDILEKRKETVSTKYGVDNVSKLPEVRKKVEQTMFENFGVICNMSTEQFKKSRDLTWKKNYPEGHPNKNKDIQQKIKNTLLERYGVDSPLKNKKIRQKVEQTCLDRYGHKRAIQLEKFKEKARYTNIERYGVTNPMLSDEIKEKLKSSNLEKYGVPYTFQNKEVKDKIRAVLLEKHGMITTKLPNGLNVAEYSKKFSKNRTHAMLIYKQFGFEELQNWIERNKSPLKEESSLERVFSQKSGLDFFNKKILEGYNYRPDFKLLDNVYIDVDGLIIHSEVFCKDTHRHFKKREKFEHAGIKLLQFREDEVRNKWPIVESILSNILDKSITTVYARNCNIKPISYSIYKGFVEQNHLQGPGPICDCYGLYYNGLLLQVFGFRYCNKLKGIGEITRFCSLIGYRITGGFSKLLSYCIKRNKIMKLRTFADLRYSYGHTYLQTGFTYVKDTLGWKWTDGIKTYNRLYCKADKQNNITELENSLKLGLVKIYDAGQRLFELNL